MEDLSENLNTFETLELVKMAQTALRQSEHPNREVRTAAEQLRNDIESVLVERINA